MTKDEIIEMARQAGVDMSLGEHWSFIIEELEAFAKLVAEKAIKEALSELEQHPQIAISPEIVGYVAPQRTWVGLTQTQVKLLWEGVQEEAVKSGDSLNWVFYTHINEALKEKNGL